MQEGKQIKINRNFFITPKTLHYSDNFSPETHERVLYVSKKFLFDTPYQNKYYDVKNDSYFSMKRLVMFSVFLSELANTYAITKQDIIAINPFYLYSMFDYTKSSGQWRRGSTWSTLYNMIKTSPYLQEYIQLEEIGGRVSDGQGGYAFFCSRYRINDKLKEYAEKELRDDMFYKVTLHEDGLLSNNNKGYIQKPVRYYDVINKDNGTIVNFAGRTEAREYIKQELNKTPRKPPHLECKEVAGFVHELEKHIDFNHPLSYYDIVTDELTNLSEHDWFAKEKANSLIASKKTMFSTDAKINKEELNAILCDVKELNTLGVPAIAELSRIEALTLDKDTYHISYYLSKYGRFYPNNCNFNLLPSRIRKRILSGYMGIDMCCSNYALNLNLAYKIYEEKKNRKGFQKRFGLLDKNGNVKDFNVMFSEVIEMCQNRKAYRQYLCDKMNAVVSTKWTVEDIKKILTMVGFGANANNALIFMKSCLDFKNCRDSALLHQGYSASEINILVNIPKFQMLASQIKTLSKIVVDSRTFSRRENGKNVRYLKSFNGAEVKIGRDTLTFSQKVAYLTQSMESVITYDVLGEATMEDLFGKELLEKSGLDSKTQVKNLTGLFLHDGFYLQSDIFDKLKVNKEQLEKILSQRITNYIRKYFEKEGLSSFILLYEVELICYKALGLSQNVLKKTA